MSSKYKALVIGGSGTVGAHVLKQLDASLFCENVVSFGRCAKLPLTHSDKIQHHKIDMEMMLEESEHLPLQPHYHVAFCTLGTRPPISVSDVALRSVDVHFPRLFSKLCQEKRVGYFGYVSFLNASPHSNDPLIKTRGEVESILKLCRFERTSFFRIGWLARQKPKLEDFPDLMEFKRARFDHYLRDKFRFTKLLCYLPTFMLPSETHTTCPEVLAKAMVADAERYVLDLDKEEMDERLGWRGLKRLYNDDFDALNKATSK